MICVFKRKPVQEAKPYEPPRESQPCSKLFNEVMQHQHEMRKKLYREMKLK